MLPMQYGSLLWENNEYGLKREKAEVAAGKMMQYGSPL